MAVAAKNQIHPVLFQQGQEVLPHIDQLLLCVRVVAAFGIRGMVPHGDDPVLSRRLQVLQKPEVLGAGGRPWADLRIQNDEVDIAVVEGVIQFGTGSHPPGLARTRQVKGGQVGRPRG